MTSWHRQILRSSAIIGSSSIIGIVLGLVRVRFAATFVGPVGIGLLGLMQNWVMLAGSLSALGIASGGAREIARARGAEDLVREGSLRRTLWVGGLTLAALGGFLAWLLLEWGSKSLSPNNALRDVSALLALASGLLVVASIQTGILTGLRRIGDIAKVNILASVLATVVAAIAFPLLREKAIIVFVIATPLISVLVGQVFLRRHPMPSTLAKFSKRDLRAMVLLGAGMTSSAVFGLGSGILVRGLIHERMGLVELGLFQASWTIASMYLGIVLQAMAADYFPRLSEHADNDPTLTIMVNDQTEILLLVGGPVVVGMIGAAPLCLWLLYGAEFTAGASLLRVQLLADVIRLLSWPLGFLLLAKAANRLFVTVEFFSVAAFVAFTWIALPSLGLVAAGWGYLTMIAVSLAGSLASVKWLIPEFRWRRQVVADALLVGAIGLLAWVIASAELLLSAAFSLAAGSALALRSYRRLSSHLPRLSDLLQSIKALFVKERRG